VTLVRDSGGVLNEAPQFVGRPEGELQWQADVCRVRQSRKSGFSAYQVLWNIAGRSASRSAVCRASFFMCATQDVDAAMEDDSQGVSPAKDGEIKITSSRTGAVRSESPVLLRSRCQESSRQEGRTETTTHSY